MSINENLSHIERKESNSKNVSYSDPVTIHESRKTKIDFIPFYIPRSEGTDFAAKIVRYEKNKSSNSGETNKSTSISLNEESAKSLLKELKVHFTIADNTDNDGDYIIIKVSDGDADFEDIETETVAEAIINVLKQEDIVQYVTSKELGNELASAFRGAIRLNELKAAISSLRSKLDSGITSEQDYQKWCENHNWAFGNAYIVKDDIRSISASDNVDLLLPSSITGYRDLVELKRPDKDILKYDSSHNNYYFSHEVTRAIGQCHRYLDVFHEEALRGLRDHPEIVAYHPRAKIVIGRSYDWGEDKKKALHGLNNRLNNISILTYDQLLLQGERIIDILDSNLNNEDDENNNWNEDDFNVPF